MGKCAGVRYLASALDPDLKLFYAGPAINTEMLILMLEKHGIAAIQEWDEAASDDPEDFNRQAEVYIRTADYARAHQLFYADREDEL